MATTFAFTRTKIKDIERQLKYEKFFSNLLSFERFKKEKILHFEQGKSWIGRIINSLVKERSLNKDGKDEYHWNREAKDFYHAEWVKKKTPLYQIKTISKEERPREKLLKGGENKLSDAELLAIFLQTGIKGKSAIDMAKNLLREFGGLRGLYSVSPEDLIKTPGLGIAKVAQLKAVIALSKRYIEEEIKNRPLVKTSKEVFNLLYQTMRDLDQEVFKVIMLNGQNEVIDIIDIFKGSLSSSTIYPREVMKQVLKYPAVGIVFVHNHPSGNPHPSKNDREITRDLVFAANIMDIKVFDHIIIGNNRYYSFADNDLIEQYNQDYQKIYGNNKS
ncbi:MAG: hypothetical protein COS47_01780 [Candidatus Nealsonbacteria bacterium CG03_land_8_20_14_0_80_36_12]|uniref:MPN domain-containing protein n=1 Tax=Candidatus Nealsonbacteria bacterium CG03_land_8_20_14_0_80_36_12 TaxID=1974701 RepID=A0A2M7BY35_9BACT|nr:MAG: hypothetical protein COS47_01780 [Candidatus Nealsonbacteria bacterium CG03_land_8_20_14_0_80_36_12]